MLTLRRYEEKDLDQMLLVWNEIVQEGIAFPQEELLTLETARTFLLTNLTRGLPTKMGRYWVYIFSTLIMLVVAGISAMRVTLFLVKLVVKASVGA